MICARKSAAQDIINTVRGVAKGCAAGEKDSMGNINAAGFD
jgi:hypothetical protein